LASSLLTKMLLLRWNNPGHDTHTSVFSGQRGAGGHEQNPRLRRREKNVLDIPLYRSVDCGCLSEGVSGTPAKNA